MKITTEQYYLEAARIFDQAKAGALTLRFLGSLAFRMHCPKYIHLLDEMKRELTDIDFVGLSRERTKLIPFMKGIGYEVDRDVMVGTEGERFCFASAETGICIDVFIDKLNYCHPIHLKDRLELDNPTISLADLLMEKMQIVEINAKDLKDTVVLLAEHELGGAEREKIDIDYISKILSNDWGFSHTFLTNLEKCENFMQAAGDIAVPKEVVISRIRDINKTIEQTPKSLRWKTRAGIGTRMKWYNDVSNEKQTY
jgi:hypothetical protein